MTLGSSQYATTNDTFSTASFPTSSRLQTTEQIRRFELLRLAFFVLKLRKLEQSHELGAVEGTEGAIKEHKFRCNLLRHAIFQQVVTLTALDARAQAMQLIDTCRR